MAKKKSSSAVFDQDDAIQIPATEGGIVTVRNVGPIDFLQIPLQPGRITLLTGSNGAGKSESLGAINALSGLGTEGLSVRDGEESGEITGFGSRVNLTLKQNRRSGNFDVLVVEEGFSLARFVRPPHKSPEANDGQRLKDLATFLGVKINLKAVHELLGGPEVYRQIVSEKTVKAQDPAEYLKSLKADCHAHALESEKLAAVIEGEAETLEGTLPEESEGESDSEVLSKRLTDATNAKQALENRVKQAAESRDMAERAQAVIDAGQGEGVDDAKATLTAAEAEAKESLDMIDELEKSLRVERERLLGLERRVSDARRQLAQAEDRADKIARAKADLESSILVAPSEDEFAHAEQEIAAAEAAFHLGAKLREAVDVRAKIAEKREEAKATAEHAKTLREVAKSVFNLLVEPINKTGCGIEVDEDNRLVVVEHPVRGRCYVDDLSPGEAWQLVIKMIVKVVGSEETPAIVAIPQEAIEGLDPIGMKMFVEAVAQTKMMIVTGSASATVRVKENGEEILEPDHVGAKIVNNWKELRT